MRMALFVFLFAVSAHAQRLTFTLSSELAKNFGPGAPHTSFTGTCQGDQDNDCLDDAMESELANKLNPRYYLDENESCGTMYTYVQIRPSAPNVDVWRVDGYVKKVYVTYFYNYPRDCQPFGGGHLGDSEHVRYLLSSTNLRTWTLENGHYWRHADQTIISGDWLSNMARGLGSDRPIVAADQNGHGSWQGEAPLSSACSSDLNIFPQRHCFNSSFAISSTWSLPPILHNVGGPDFGRLGGPERWRGGTPHLTISGTTVYTQRDGAQEYWAPKRDFCGWRCPFGGCTDCAGSLDNKIDKGAFRRQSRPITAGDNGGTTLTYQCTFTRNGGPEMANYTTWTARGRNPQGHLLYTINDIGGTHYYRLWYSAEIDQGSRWILESVAPNDWQGAPLVRCDDFYVLHGGNMVIFNACSNGVWQRCFAP
ncbi:MAG TPA: hypothetical protein VF618_03865 [Thermoanaerobaculia bacterium]